VSRYYQIHETSDSSAGELTSSLSRHKDVNSAMETATRLVRSYIESHSGVRVTEVIVDYHVDEEDVMRLCIIPSISTVSNTAPPSDSVARNRQRQLAALGQTSSPAGATDDSLSDAPEWEQLSSQLGKEHAASVSLAREILGDTEATRLAQQLTSSGTVDGMDSLLKTRVASTRKRSIDPRKSRYSSGSDTGSDGRRRRPTQQAVTHADVSELRSFKRPPPGVELAVSAALLLITGRTAQWARSRRLLSSGATGGGLLGAIARFDLDKCPQDRIQALLPIVDGPAFKTQSMAPVSMAAAKLASWVALMTRIVGEARATNQLPSTLLMERYGTALPDRVVPELAGMIPVEAEATMRTEEDVDDDEEGDGIALLPAEPVKRPVAVKPAVAQSKTAEASSRPPRLSSTENARRMARQDVEAKPVEDAAKPKFLAPPMGVLTSSNNRSAPALATTTASLEAPGLEATTGQPGDWIVEPGSGGGLVMETERNEYVCHGDEIHGLSASWVLVGEPDGTRRARDFVILTDFFETGDSLLPFVRPVAMRTRSRFLLVNLPGQAHTRFRATSNPDLPLNNQVHARVLHELLQHLDAKRVIEVTATQATTSAMTAERAKGSSSAVKGGGVYISGAVPGARPRHWHLVGFGNGAATAVAFGSMFGTMGYQGSLSSIVSINGFVRTDAQLSAVMHASESVFACFPEGRPDLAESYFSRFLFSDPYLKAVTPEGALKRLSASPNPITPMGRSALCKGVLAHRDFRREVPKIPFPLVLVHSTDSVLVPATAVEEITHGRDVRHITAPDTHRAPTSTVKDPKGVALPRLSPQLIPPGVMNSLVHTLASPGGRALVVWVSSGHCVRLESALGLLQLFTVLADPDAASDEADARLDEAAIVAAKHGGAMTVGAYQDAVKASFTAVAAAAPMAKSAFDIDWDVERQGASGVVHPLKMLNPTQRREKKDQRRLRLALAGATDGTSMSVHREGGDMTEQDIAALAVAGATAGMEPPARRSRSVAGTVSNTGTVISRATATGSVMGATVQRTAPGESKPTSGFWSSGAVKAYDPATEVAPETPDVTSMSPRIDPMDPQARLDRLRREQSERRQLWEMEERKRLDSLKEDLWRRHRERLEHAEVTSKKSQQEVLDARAAASAAVERAQAAAKSIPVTDEAIKKGWIAVTDVGAPDPGEDEDEAVGIALTDRSSTVHLKGSVTTRAAQSSSMAGGHGSKTTVPRMAATEDVRSLLAKSTLHSSLRPEPSTETRALADIGDRAYAGIKAELEEARREEMETALLVQRREEEEEYVRRLPEFNMRATDIQCAWRCFLARRHARQRRAVRAMETAERKAARMIQAHIRGRFGRLHAHQNRMKKLREIFLGDCAARIQRAYRRYIAQCAAAVLRVQGAARDIQRVFRGHMGRRYARALLRRRNRLLRENQAATCIQSAWKRHRVMEGYREIQILRIAATTIQRIWRGYVDRRFAKDLVEWEDTESGPLRLAVGVRIMNRESGALKRFQVDMEEAARAEGRCQNRAQHTRRRLRRVQRELKNVRQRKGVFDRQAERLDELSRDRDALEAAIRELDEEHKRATRSKRGNLDVQLLQQLAVVHGIRIPVGMARKQQAAEEVETESSGDSDGSEARERRAARARRRRQKAQAAAAQSDMQEKHKILRKAQARAEERESTSLAVRLRRAELGKLVLEFERRENALIEHGAALEETAEALEDQAERLAMHRRRRQQELSRLVTRIQVLADRQQSEFNAIQDRISAARQRELMERTNLLIEQAHRQAKALAQHRANRFAIASEAAISTFTRPLAVEFLSSVTLIGVIEDGTAASRMRALEFVYGNAAARAAHPAPDRQLPHMLKGPEAAAAGKEAALIALGFGKPGTLDGFERRERRGQLVGAASTGVQAPSRPGTQTIPRLTIQDETSRAVSPLKRKPLQFGNHSGALVKKKKKHPQDEEEDEDAAAEREQKEISQQRRRDAIKWRMNREKKIETFRTTVATGPGMEYPDSARSDEDYAAGIVVDELEETREQAQTMLASINRPAMDEDSSRSRALRRALALGASTHLDVAAKTGLTHAERTADVDYSFRFGAYRTNRLKKASAARFLPASLKEYVAPDLEHQLREFEEAERKRAALREEEERLTRRRQRKLRRMVDSSDDESDHNGDTLDEMRGGSLAVALDNARAEAFGDELPADVRKWSVDDVVKWFQAVGMGMYAPNAREAAVDGATLISIKPVDIRDILGIDKIEHIRAVNAYRQRLSAPPPTYVKPGAQLKRWRMGRYIPPEEAEDFKAAGLDARPALPTDQLAQAGPTERPVKAEAVVAAAKLGKYQRVEMALAKGMDPDSVSGDGLERTGLHMAALRVDRRMAAIFLRYGAFVNCQDKYGNTPLHYAVALDPTGEVVEFLLDRGADDRTKNRIGCRPSDKRLGAGAEEGTVVIPKYKRYEIPIPESSRPKPTGLVSVRKLE
jgi:hypothetical protein